MTRRHLTTSELSTLAEALEILREHSERALAEELGASTPDQASITRHQDTALTSARLQRALYNKDAANGRAVWTVS